MHAAAFYRFNRNLLNFLAVQPKIFKFSVLRFVYKFKVQHWKNSASRIVNSEGSGSIHLDGIHWKKITRKVKNYE
jgi:hypothetical protein